MSIPGSASPLLLASTAAAGGYQVSRSLRFNAPDTAFLNRTPAVAGNRKTWTWAGWVKRCQFGTYEHIFNGTGSSPSYAQFYWSPTEQLVFDNGGSGAITTTQVFRDPSAWYHIVLTFDTTQGTAADRMRMYANGQQITTFSSSSYPTQNSDGGMNQASAHFIGKDSSFAGFYLADIHFIDGQALTPSSFTEVSATTGQLIPKAYTGTYGTNGFHLPFSDNSTTAALGTDTSGNSNNWTPNNFSVVSGPANVITVPSSNAPPTVDYLVVGGGGAGGYRIAGGGGGGGFRTGSAFSVSPGTYTVTVGSGGVAGAGRGGNGEDSVFGSITAAGGGGGATVCDGPTSGANGGSGGGGSVCGGAGAGGTGNTPSTSPAQGTNGGAGSDTNPYKGGGGGGGATNAGVAFSSASDRGQGGNGTASSITGTSVTYAGGGSGGSLDETNIGVAANLGGLGGGGNGAGPNQDATSGGVNTGGGGGGGGSASSSGKTGKQGGSGIVVLRYANTYADLTVASSLTYTYANTGGYKIYSFTASVTPAQSAGNDSLVDTPTSIAATDTGVGNEVRGNYATFNPLALGSYASLTNGNLDITGNTSANSGGSLSTVGFTSGKYYYEYVANSTGAVYGGVVTFYSNDTSTLIDENYVFGTSGANKGIGIRGSGTIMGNVAERQSIAAFTYSAGEVIGVAIDADYGAVYFSKSGSFLNSGVPTSGASRTGSFHNWTPSSSRICYPAVTAYQTSASASANFGQRAFAYTAPSGFKALCDTNLGDPLVAKPNTVFDVITYTGTGSSLTLPNGSSTPTSISFTPDFAWLKGRSGATDHALYDAVRDVQKDLVSNSTSAETTETTGLTAFGTNTFTVGSLAKLNTSSSTYVAWAWNAGGTTASNTDGSITSQVRANPTAGFSVVAFNSGSGAPTAYTVGHGLNVAPQFIITKSRTSASYNWSVYHTSIATTTNKYLSLNSTNATADNGTSIWGAAQPTSTVFGITSGNAVVANTDCIAYCFAPVDGYSSFGSYVGNGSADGPFVYTGFRPRWVLFKRSDSTSNWYSS
jgi:hypothetical protein